MNQIAVQGSQIKGNFNLFAVCWESIWIFFWIEHEILDFLRPSDCHLGQNWRFPFQIPSQRTNAPSPFDDYPGFKPKITPPNISVLWNCFTFGKKLIIFSFKNFIKPNEGSKISPDIFNLSLSSKKKRNQDLSAIWILTTF